MLTQKTVVAVHSYSPHNEVLSRGSKRDSQQPEIVFAEHSASFFSRCAQRPTFSPSLFFPYKMRVEGACKSNVQEGPGDGLFGTGILEERERESEVERGEEERDTTAKDIIHFPCHE